MLSGDLGAGRANAGEGRYDRRSRGTKGERERHRSHLMPLPCTSSAIINGRRFVLGLFILTGAKENALMLAGALRKVI